MAVSAVAGVLGGLVKGIAVAAKGAAGAAAKGAGRLAVSGAKVAGRGAVRGAKAVGRGAVRGGKAVGRGAVRGAKAAGKGLRRGAKSGKKMAKNMMKRVEDAKEIRKQMKARKGGGGGSGESTSSKLGPSSTGSSGGSTGNAAIDNALNNIDNAILGMLKGEQQSIKEANLEDTRTQRRRREGVLESGSKFIRGLASKAPKAMKKTFDAMGKFIKNVVIGSILLYILNQWDSIVEAFKKTVETLKELWKNLKPWVKGAWDFFKGIWKVVSDWGGKLFGSKDGEQESKMDSVKNDLEGVKEKLKPVDEGFEGLKKKAGELKDAIGIKGDKPKTDLPEDTPPGSKDVKPKSSTTSPSSPPRESSDTIDPLVVLEMNKSLVPFGMYDLVRNEVMSNPSSYDTKAEIEAALSGFGIDPSKVIYPPSSNLQSSRPDNSGSLKNNSSKQLADATPIIKKPADKLSQGLDTHASYEKAGEPNNIILAKNNPPQSGGGEGQVKILPVPIVNNAKDVAKNIYNYELSKV